ncbi:MAG: DNA-3-methyladenine glycosylase I [Oceanicaulis sp.]
MNERCPWCGTDPVYVAYHDTEWGVPEYDSRALFEKLVLDGFQAGLAWITILKKRENFRAAFDGFDPGRIARYGEADIQRLLGDAGIVRSRAKIEAAITGARIWCDIEESDRNFSARLWDFVDGAPVQNTWRTMAEAPAKTAASAAMSRELKRLGFKFCGPVIVYAFMQACGLVNDHLVSCHRHGAVSEMGGRL